MREGWLTLRRGSSPTDAATGAICLALTEGARPLLSVIFQPFLGAIYTATFDHGASVNDAPIHVAPSTTPLKESAVGLLLDHWRDDDYLALRFLTNLRAQTQRVLMNWTVSLDCLTGLVSAGLWRDGRAGLPLWPEHAREPSHAGGNILVSAGGRIRGGSDRAAHPRFQPQVRDRRDDSSAP